MIAAAQGPQLAQGVLFELFVQVLAVRFFPALPSVHRLDDMRIAVEPQGHGVFDVGPDVAHLVPHPLRVQRRLDRHHTTADIHAHASRHDGAQGGHDRAHSGTLTHVHVGHDGHVTENKRKPGGVLELLEGLGLHL